MTDAPTVLVVDDNEDLLKTFSMILKRRGFHVETAENGASAVDKFNEHNFDVTLMDIVMPKMNGVEAFRKIREMHPGAAVILMTAYSDEELIQIAKDEGAHHVLHKPIKIDKIIELIKEAIENQPILIVDDDDDICHTLTRALELDGYQVLAAHSGEEAIFIAQEKACQIAFIDIKLPNIDGLETFLRLKEINPDILTVMMTGFRNEVKEALEKAQAASAIACLYKPFDPSEVADLVRQMAHKTCNSGNTDEA
jgi:DNA-binding NtrC family response regulator